jgi:hypothetical protein
MLWPRSSAADPSTAGTVIPFLHGDTGIMINVATSPATTPVSNPYVVGRPLTGASASLYVGREETFSWLEENLVGTARPNALLLYGQRRIGKTSTLYQVTEGERGKGLRNARERSLLTAYFDLQRLAGRPTDEWLRRLARDICNRVNTSMLARSVPDSPTAGETAYAAFDRCLDRLEQTLPPDHLILLAIDELEQIRAGIDAGTLDLDVLSFLRSQIQHRERIVFLLCGSRALLDGFWNPIIDLTARLELNCLDFEQTALLVRRPVAGVLDYEDSAVAAIWQHTAGHPFHVQTICHRLVSLINRRHSRDLIRARDVEHVIRQLDKEGYHVGLSFEPDHGVLASVEANKR